MTLELRGIPGEPYMSGRCTCCGARVRVSRKPGTTDCACGAVYNNLSGELVDLSTELGHRPVACEETLKVLTYVYVGNLDSERRCRYLACPSPLLRVGMNVVLVQGKDDRLLGYAHVCCEKDAHPEAELSGWPWSKGSDRQ